jgi:hypothetical protein
MNAKYDKHEINYIKAYQERGFTSNYHFENGRLIDTETKYAYRPDEIFIVAQHRYEGMSDPEDLSILYIIETADQSKGTFLLGYGPSSDLEASEFFKDIPEANCSDKASIHNT